MRNLARNLAKCGRMEWSWRALALAWVFCLLALPGADIRLNIFGSVYLALAVLRLNSISVREAAQGGGAVRGFAVEFEYG